MPIAVWAMSLCRPHDRRQVDAPLTQNSLLFFGIFLVIGMVLGKLMRMALDEAIGPDAGIGDRLAGAALGAVRVGLVAVTLVLIFDQLVPPDRQPAYLARLAAAAAVVGGRAKRLSVAAAGGRGHDRSPEERPADIRRSVRLAADAASLSLICISAASGVPYQGRPGWLQWRDRTSKII